jgi:hypothetical protein
MFRSMTTAENDAVIAALRLWQAVQASHVVLVMSDGGPCGLDYLEDVSTNAGEHDEATSEQIDVLLDECFGLV